MKKVRLKRLIRKFVLATSFPPFLKIYHALYALVIRAAIIFFRKYPAIKAVYLRRGCAKGEMLPGVSDIDFGVIAEGMDEGEKKSLRRAYDKFARFTVVPDHEYLDIFDAETFYKSHDISRKRKLFLLFMEGKATWKLLYGKDYLAALQPLPIEKLYGGLYQEIKTWWKMFCQKIFQGEKNHAEVPIRNSVCYKAVSEILKMNLAFYHDTMIFSRSETLERAKLHLSGEERVLVDKLETLARRRFLINGTNIVEETKDFLLTFLDRFYKEFHTHDYARSLKNVTQRVDCHNDEVMRDEGDHVHVGRLLDYLRKKWSHTYKGAYLVSGVYFDLDERALMIGVDPARLPTLEELTEIYLLHSDSRLQLSSHIHLYLLMPHAAFKIDAMTTWQSILSPCSNPDVFDSLGRVEFALDGTKYHSDTSPIWTPPVTDFISERKSDLYEQLLLRDPKFYRKNSLTFLRRFWKALQLVIISRSAQKDEILYPLTLPAIERALATQGTALPPRLQYLGEAYHDKTKGKPCDVSALVPDAIAYLKEIYV